MWKPEGFLYIEESLPSWLVPMNGKGGFLEGEVGKPRLSLVPIYALS